MTATALKRRHWDFSVWQDLGAVDTNNLIDYVWPGGYPVVYVDPEADSEGLCSETVRAMIAAGEWPDGKSVDSFTHYEGRRSGVHVRQGHRSRIRRS